MRRKPSPRPALTSNPCSAARRARQPYGASGAPGGSRKTIGRTSLLVPQPARRHFCWSPLSRARWKSPARLSLAASSQAIPRDRARYPPRRPSSRHRWAPRRPPHSRTTPGPRPRTAAAYGLPCRAVELQGSGPAQRVHTDATGPGRHAAGAAVGAAGHAAATRATFALRRGSRPCESSNALPCARLAHFAALGQPSPASTALDLPHAQREGSALRGSLPIEGSGLPPRGAAFAPGSRAATRG